MSARKAAYSAEIWVTRVEAKEEGGRGVGEVGIDVEAHAPMKASDSSTFCSLGKYIPLSAQSATQRLDHRRCSWSGRYSREVSAIAGRLAQFVRVVAVQPFEC